MSKQNSSRTGGIGENDGTSEEVKKDDHSGMGRPSSYRGEYAEQAMKLYRLGVTDQEIADFFDVSVATLNRWKHVHPDFMESMKRGKMHADANVADRLYQRACGYSHVAVKFVTHKGIITDREEYVKHYPPDTQACIFWLKNRRPDLWREKVEIEPNRELITIKDAHLPVEEDDDEVFMRFIANTCERQRLEKEEEEEERRVLEQQRQELEQQEQQQEERRRDTELEQQQDTQQVTSEDSPETTPEVDPNSLEARINLSSYQKSQLRNEEMMRAWQEEQAVRQRQREEDCTPRLIKW